MVLRDAISTSSMAPQDERLRSQADFFAAFFGVPSANSLINRAPIAAAAALPAAFTALVEAFFLPLPDP